MATTTTKLALTKPDGTDLVDIAVLNANADKIDTASGAFVCTSTTRPASPWNGQVIFETDTLNALVYRTSTTSWNILGGSTVSSAPPAGAGNGNFWWDSDNGKLYIYYQDGNSSQWVSVMPAQTTVEVADNVIINGAFEINQRSFTSATTSGYGFDRWRQIISGDGTKTYSSQTFTLGDEPSDSILGSTYARILTSGQSSTTSRAVLAQAVENVKTLSGQTATVSFWARAGSGTPKVAVEFQQNFGSGGSPSTAVNTYAGQVTLSTSWVKYSLTVTIPSLSGKTIGTTANTSLLDLSLAVSAGSDFDSRYGSLGIQNNTFDFWGVQVEQGSVATSFRRSTNNIQSELAACQRYCLGLSVSASGERFGIGMMGNSSTGNIYIYPPVTMRSKPSTLTFSALADFNLRNGDATISVTPTNIVLTTSSTPNLINIDVSGTVATNQPAYLRANNANALLVFSAEL